MRIRFFNTYGRYGARQRQRSRGITFIGEDGKVPRRVAGIAAALLVFLIIMLSMRVEPSLMSSAEVATVHDRGVLSVGVRTDIPGFAFDGEGLEVELAKRLALRIMQSAPDWKGDADAVRLVEVTSMTVGARLDDGTIDVAIALMRKGDCTKYVYSDSYYQDTCRFVVGKGNEEMPIRNMRIGYIKSSSTSSVYVQSSVFSAMLTSYLAAHPDDALEKQAFASYEDMFRAIEKGSIGAAVLSDAFLSGYLDRFNIAGSATTLGELDYAIACQSANASFASIADLMLSEMREDGSLAALLQQYGLG